MVKPLLVPSHPDAAVRWLAANLARTAKSPYEETLPAWELPGKRWLRVRQRLERELEQHVVRPPR
jgi:hypothetical protein